MTSKYLVILLGYMVGLAILRSVVAEECSQYISNENCSLTTYNNEIEALSPTHAQEVTTHATTTISSTMTVDKESTEALILNASSPSLNSKDLSIEPVNSTTLNSSESQNSQTASNSLINSTAKTLETATSSPFAVFTSTLSESSTLNSFEVSTANSSDTSTVNSIETPNSKPLETSTSIVIDKVPEGATTNLSETTSSKAPESLSSNLMEGSTSSYVDETSNFVETSTETSTANSSDLSTDALLETSTSTTFTEHSTDNLTENPTEVALNSVNDETTITSTTTTATTTVALTKATDEPKGRALNFSEDKPNNVLTNMSDERDDDSIHDHDDFNIGVDSLDPKILAPKNQIHNYSLGICEKGGLTYENGERLELGCDSICTCKYGKMNCTDRCVGPYFRKGKKIDDPLCIEKEAKDPCCSILVCTSDTETEPLEMCTYENKTYNRGDTFNKGCTEVCTCEVAGKIVCKPRCPPVTKTSDRCVEIPDENDFCCLKVLCDVTLDDHDTEKDEDKERPKLLAAKYVNASAILLTFDSNMKYEDNENLPIVEVSDDKISWKYYQLLPGNIVFVKNKVKYLKLENTNTVVEVEDRISDLDLQLDSKHDSTTTEHESDTKGCYYKSKTFKDKEEYNDECESLCVCQNGEMKCLKLECPTYFGVDVLDPSCIEWETIPPDFVPSAPNCCPEKVRCKNNGSCEYEGQIYKNWDEIPSNVTGCEKKCYCEMGNVECQNICPPVTALPPPTLNCSPNFAMVSHLSDDDCCKYWVCKTEVHHPSGKPLTTYVENHLKGQTTTDKHTGQFKKVTTKVLGPLSVYVNDDDDPAFPKNPLGVPNKPKINPHENPFYHKQVFSVKSKLTDQIHALQIIPYSPSNKNKIFNKVSKNHTDKSIQKDNKFFVTPLPPVENPFKNHKNFIPNYYNPPPSSPSLSTNFADSAVPHSPDKTFPFIYEHPETSTYSSKFIENHDVGTSNNIKLPFGNQGASTVTSLKIHLVPYIIPQNAQGEPVKDDLPPGLSLEEILQEFQKNSQGFQNNPLAFFPSSQKNRTDPNSSKTGILATNKHNASMPVDDGHTSLLPDSYPGFPNHPSPREEIIITSLEAIDPHKVKLTFTVPSIIVGLHGRFEVRYTHNKDENDLDSWMLTVFAPPNDLIGTSSLEFELTDLKSNTEYSIKITVTLRDLHNMPTSKIYKVKTPKEVHPPVIPIDPDLAIVDINATWVTVTWRAFTQYELQFIDGIQLRYKELEGRLFTATSLIHRAVTRYTLENLKPNTKYEIGIYFIPFPDQETELRAEKMLHFTTANEIDTYGFNVTLEISQIKSQSVEISWSGVPYPEDKYVNIYRAIYQSNSGKEDHSTFKIAKRDSPSKTIIKDLKPGTGYRLWLEVYLTNGKIKTSNVEDFVTKVRPAPALGSSTQQDKLARAEVLQTKGDYYGPLVIVAILAAVAILTTLILLLILVRRHNQNKASITPPSTRISQSAYDNPTYKVEIQQETMGL